MFDWRPFPLDSKIVAIIFLFFYFLFFCPSLFCKSGSVPIGLSYFYNYFCPPVFFFLLGLMSQEYKVHTLAHEWGKYNRRGFVGISASLARLFTFQNIGCVVERYCVWQLFQGTNPSFCLLIFSFFYFSLTVFHQDWISTTNGCGYPSPCLSSSLCPLPCMSLTTKSCYWTTKSQEILCKAVVICLSYLR